MNLLCLFTGVWRWVLGACFALTLVANIWVFGLTVVNSFKFLPESPKQRAIIMATVSDERRPSTCLTNSNPPSKTPPPPHIFSQRLVIVSMIKWSVALFITIDHNLNLNAVGLGSTDQCSLHTRHPLPHASGRALLAFYYCQNPIKSTNILQRSAILAANIAILYANIDFAGNIRS